MMSADAGGVEHRCGSAFPVLYAAEAATTARFYERLGFAVVFQMPGHDGQPGYVGLARGGDRMGVVSREWPAEQYGVVPGDRPRAEMFVYVDDVEAAVQAVVAAGARLLRAPQDMPWGERVGYVTDPDGNPVALAAPL